MPTAFTLGLNQYAMYWSKPVSDGLGGKTSPEVVLIRCRWEQKAVRFRTPSGEELTSSSVVYVDRQLEPGGLLAFGDLSDDVDSDGMLEPSSVNAREIKQLNESPSIAADQVLYKAMLI